ncbi:MAG: hypothetical protein ABFE13_15840 [Phycisphaerales bacterium]
MARNQYSFEKRRREIEKKKKNQEKMERKLGKTDSSRSENPDAPSAEVNAEPVADPSTP